MMSWLADVELNEYRTGLKSLVFVGGFALICIAAAIWWLRR